MEMNILYFIQSLHNPILDKIMVAIFNDIVGTKGEIWIILGIILLCFKKTRKTGLIVLSSYIISYYIGDGLLKNLIARPRPCTVDESVELLIARSTSYSCPSVHSMLALGSAVPIYFYHKKYGRIALIFAILICFSRLYFFVHYPTDVLFGGLLGAGIGLIISYVCKGIKA